MKFKRTLLLALVTIGFMLASTADVSATTMNYQGGWLAKTTYPAAAVVVLKNQTYYALVGGNLNKNPVAFPTLWQPLGTFVPTTYKIGSRGPGGGDPNCSSDKSISERGLLTQKPALLFGGK